MAPYRPPKRAATFLTLVMSQAAWYVAFRRSRGVVDRNWFWWSGAGDLMGGSLHGFMVKRSVGGCSRFSMIHALSLGLGHGTLDRTTGDRTTGDGTSGDRTTLIG